MQFMEQTFIGPPGKTPERLISLHSAIERTAVHRFGYDPQRISYDVELGKSAEEIHQSLNDLLASRGNKLYLASEQIINALRQLELKAYVESRDSRTIRLIFANYWQWGAPSGALATGLFQIRPDDVSGRYADIVDQPITVDEAAFYNWLTVPAGQEPVQPNRPRDSNATGNATKATAKKQVSDEERKRFEAVFDRIEAKVLGRCTTRQIAVELAKEDKQRRSAGPKWSEHTYRKIIAGTYPLMKRAGIPGLRERLDNDIRQYPAISTKATAQQGHRR
jgi:hypothetical protein